MNQNTTLKQYAFAIGFDFESSLDAVESPPGSEEIAAQLESISTAIQSAGLPTIDSDRWDEFGQGRIFWGTKPECDAVKSALSQFPLFVQEERNLESGYYATPTHTYYADESGNLYQLQTPTESENGSWLELTASIPLDAYRLKSIDANLQAAVERSLPAALPEQDLVQSSFESPLSSEAQQAFVPEAAEDLEMPSIQPSSPTEVEALPPTADAQEPWVSETGLPTAEPLVSSEHLEQENGAAQAEEEIAALQAQVSRLSSELETLQTTAAEQGSLALEAVSLQSQVAQQAAHIHELERQVTVFEDQISFLQAAAAAKIDPQEHANVEAQLAQQTQHLQQIEVRLAQAENQAKEWQSRSEQSIDPQVYAQLQQQFNLKVTQIQELQQQTQRLEQQLQDAVAIAAKKIEPAKYQALEQSVVDITAQAEGFRRTIQELQRDLSEWQTVAESKVEWSEYQALQEELRQLKAKQKRGLLSRLFGWLFG